MLHEHCVPDMCHFFHLLTGGEERRYLRHIFVLKHRHMFKLISLSFRTEHDRFNMCFCLQLKMTKVTQVPTSVTSARKILYLLVGM